MQAVIPAAGRGIRLRPLTEKLPKGLIKVGDKTLLERSLEALKKNGITEAIIILGFCSEQIKEKLGDNYKGVNIIYTYNDEYVNTGSMYSLTKAKDLIKGDIILLESDLLYDPEGINALLDSPYQDAILVASARRTGDEVFICTDKDNNILALGKNLEEEQKSQAIGELVGISRLSKPFLDRLFDKVDMDHKEGKFNFHYEESIFETSKIFHPIKAVLKGDLNWTEIDCDLDLEFALNQVYPALFKKYHDSLTPQHSQLKAVILAAGMGTRLRQVHSDPKSLLKFNDETLLKRHLRLLNEFGIKEVSIVVGYQKEKIIEHLGNNYLDTNITYLHNYDYHQGNIVSLHKAKEHIYGDVLIMDADVYYDKRILKHIIVSEHKNLVVMDPNFSNVGDEYLIAGRNGSVEEMGFNAALDNSSLISGEEVGFTKLSKESALIFFSQIEEFMQDNDDVLWAELLNKLVKEKTIPLNYLTTDNLRWVQINYPYDLKTAEEISSEILH